MCTAFNGQGDELEAVSDNVVSEIFRAIAMVFALVLSSCGDGQGPVVSETTAQGTDVEIRISTASEQFTPSNPVQVQAIFDATGMPGAGFTLLPPDDKAFGEFTARHIGEAVEFSICGEVVAAPILQEAIHGGGLMLSGTDIQHKIADYLAEGCR